jgi:hypothetical protein
MIQRLVFFTFLLGFQYSHAADICHSDNIIAIQSSENSYLNLKDLFRASTQEVNLHIFGEAHYNTRVDLLDRIITSFRSIVSSNQSVCLFLEMPVGGLDALAHQLAEGLVHEDPEVRKMAMQAKDYYPSIIKSAKKSSLKVFEIDHPDQLGDGASEDDRNLFMARKAKDILNRKECDQTIFLVGKAHISPLEFRKSIPDILTELKIKFHTYNVNSYMVESEPDLVSWPSDLCSLDIEDIPVASSTENFHPYSVLFPKFTTIRSPVWVDFDFLIFK